MSVFVTLYAKPLAIIISFISLKYAYLVNHSIITSMLSYFHSMLGSYNYSNFMMKSIITLFHTSYGGGRGYSNLYSLCLSFLFIPHFTYALIMSLTLPFT